MPLRPIPYESDFMFKYLQSERLLCFAKEATRMFSLHDPRFMTAVADPISYPRESIFGLCFSCVLGGAGANSIFHL